MDDAQARAAFAALSHDTRLAVFRLAVRVGPGGLPALEIARRLGVKPSTLSAHLAVLREAGLLTATRQHKEIIYAPALGKVNQIVRYLLDDCCDGHPEACGDVAALGAVGALARG